MLAAVAVKKPLTFALIVISRPTLAVRVNCAWKLTWTRVAAIAFKVSSSSVGSRVWEGVLVEVGDLVTDTCTASVALPVAFPWANEGLFVPLSTEYIKKMIMTVARKSIGGLRTLLGRCNGGILDFP
jgi:hypothetical protein